MSHTLNMLDDQGRAWTVLHNSDWSGPVEIDRFEGPRLVEMHVLPGEVVQAMGIAMYESEKEDAADAAIPYEEKFAVFLKMTQDLKGKADVVAIAEPYVLGDTYEEVIRSLNHLAEAGLMLAIASEELR